MSAILKIFGLPGTIALALALAFAGVAGVTLVRLHLVTAKLEVSETLLSSAEQRSVNSLRSAQSWRATAAERLALLEACQVENTRIANETAAGLARAEAARTDAERTLAQFTRRYAEAIRIPACADARAKLDAACPAMEY